MLLSLPRIPSFVLFVLLFGAASTGAATTSSVDWCGRNGIAKFDVAFDVRKKYNVPSATDCCAYCSAQADITGWSWSLSYQTCICQNPPPGTPRQAHSARLSTSGRSTTCRPRPTAAPTAVRKATSPPGAGA
eukprot:TRINITY_DN1188_c0_g1_i4.p2 TRINITY_DN1188_c0_g1~~TRINITY_DN1188_c0_g1_i4.p2  ORF type:complete len:132 (+),score=14.97 TRINITY_DN1188_c0_g1_i4:278-673(+)